MRAEDTMHRQVLYIRRIIERGSFSSKEQVATGIGGTLRADLDQLPGREPGTVPSHSAGEGFGAGHDVGFQGLLEGARQ
jgi:hypothetical protein